MTHELRVGVRLGSTRRPVNDRSREFDAPTGRTALGRIEPVGHPAARDPDPPDELTKSGHGVEGKRTVTKV